MNKDLLIEIGTEELPPKALPVLSRAFHDEVGKGLTSAGLTYSAIEAFATPRRLALIVRELQERQDDAVVEKLGPAIAAAFDQDGKPTKAAEGFARSCGVKVEDLQDFDDGKVRKLMYQATQEGQPAASLVPNIVQNALNVLPIPKRMRWGSSRVEFVRPVHWVVLLFGVDIIPAEILGVSSGSKTYGHRFLHPGPIGLDSPSDYVSRLESKGKVIASFDKRKENIRQQVMDVGTSLGAEAVIEEDLLEEVTALVEWPVALTGSFAESFLTIPKEALISSLKEHQKCFYLLDGQGNMLPHFITISNLISRDPAQVIAGNERVIGPRLTDAAFFYDQDKKQSLESRRGDLKSVIFQQDLGTVYDKTERVSRLAGFIAEQLGFDEASSVRAAQLAKCDLLTSMVGEFAELQGIMGYYYARHDGEDEEIALALREQYLPRFAGDNLPASDTGTVVALAERLDTLVGLFGIGQPPTGSKDPFALRRTTLGILRIIIEKELDLDLSACVDKATANFGELRARDGLEARVLDFIFERLRAWYSDRGIQVNVFLAVDAVRPASPLEFDHRVRAVNNFATLPEADALAAANKRVANILSKLDTTPDNDIDGDLLIEKEERALAEEIEQLAEHTRPLLLDGDYTAALEMMASLQNSVDRFFDHVMVNTEELALRSNRLALLHRLRGLFLQVADISCLQKT